MSVPMPSDKEILIGIAAAAAAKELYCSSGHIDLLNILKGLWEKIKAAAEALWETLKNIAKGIIALIKSIYDAIVAAIKALYKKLKDLWKSIFGDGDICGSNSAAKQDAAAEAKKSDANKSTLPSQQQKTSSATPPTP